MNDLISSFPHAQAPGAAAAVRVVAFVVAVAAAALVAVAVSVVAHAPAAVGTAVSDPEVAAADTAADDPVPGAPVHAALPLAGDPVLGAPVHAALAAVHAPAASVVYVARARHVRVAAGMLAAPAGRYYDCFLPGSDCAFPGGKPAGYARQKNAPACQPDALRSLHWQDGQK